MPDAETVAEQLSDAIRLWYRAGNVSLHDVDEARWVLEMQCVDLAARRRTEDDLEAIHQPIHLASNPDLDLAEWLQLDIEFHTAITRAAKNQILELAMSVHLMRPATNTVFVDLLDREAVWAQHTDRIGLAAQLRHDAPHGIEARGHGSVGPAAGPGHAVAWPDWAILGSFLLVAVGLAGCWGRRLGGRMLPRLDVVSTGRTSERERPVDVTVLHFLFSGTSALIRR